MAINTYFQNIANAIRTKTGSAGLITPAEMPDEILNIPAGATFLIEPEHTEVHNGYLNTTGYFYYGIDLTYNSYIYKNIPAGKYLIIRNGGNNNAKLRVAKFNSDPINFTSNTVGSSIGYNDTSTEFSYFTFTLYETIPFIMAYMGFANANAKTCLINLNDLFG